MDTSSLWQWARISGGARACQPTTFSIALVAWEFRLEGLPGRNAATGGTIPPVRIDRIPPLGEPGDYPALEDFFACFSMRFSFKVFSGFFLVSFFAS